VEYEVMKEKFADNFQDWTHGDYRIILGTTEMLQSRPSLIQEIVTMINISYYEALKHQLGPSETTYERSTEEWGGTE